MAFNAYLVFHKDSAILGESTSVPEGGKPNTAIEIQDYGFGVNMPVTTSRSDGGGATVGRANFDAFTCTKGIDTATCMLVKHCCTGKNIKAIVLHLYRAGAESDSGTVKYAVVTFHHCVITKCTISGSGEELPKESMEFNYGKCEYQYKLTSHTEGKADSTAKAFGWTTIQNKVMPGMQKFDDWDANDPKD